jgi:Skp family chaperone for outer membrane proteins
MNTLRNLAAAALATTFLTAQEGKPTGPAADASATKQAASQVPTAGLRIGVVDLVRAIDQYPKWIRMQGDFATLQKGYKARFETNAAEASRLKAQLEVMGETESEARKVAEFTYELKLQESRAWQKLVANQLEIEHARMMLVVYEDLEIAIAKVAKARDVAIVLRMHNMGPSLGDVAKLSDNTVAGRVNAFERREVLYASNQVDLTDDLIKLLQVPLEEPKGAAKDAKDKDAKAETPKAPEKAGTQKTGG